MTTSKQYYKVYCTAKEHKQSITFTVNVWALHVTAAICKGIAAGYEKYPNLKDVWSTEAVLHKE